MSIWQILGLFLFLDDAVISHKDFGKTDHVHHYMVGLALMAFG